MRSILDSQTKRRVDIIEYLTSVEFSSIEKLVEVSNASDKTIISDLNYIEKNWGKDLQMERYRDVYYFKVKNVAMLHKVFRKLFSESLPVSFVLELFNKPNEKMSVYAKKLHVSESSLYRLLPGLNEYFKTINLVIKNNQGLYYLKSKNECHFRHFITALYLQTQYIDEILKQKEFRNIERVINGYIDDSKIITDVTEKSFYMIYYKLSLIRELQGFKGPFTSPLGAEKAYAILVDSTEGLDLKSIERIHGGITKMVMPHDKNKDESIALKDSLIKELDLDLTLEKEERLLSLCANAFTHINFYPYRIASLFDRYHYFTLLFRKQNRQLYAQIEKIISGFSTENDDIFTLAIDYFVYYLNVYFYKELQNRQEIKILVVSELGIEHSEFLSGFIKNHFQFTNIDHKELFPLAFSKGNNKFDKSKYDLILSTAVLENLEMSEYALINDYPNNRDLSIIAEAIQILHDKM